MARRAAIVSFGLLAAFVVVTLIALEGREVVVVRTRDANGTEHATRTWIADADGVAWIEAANPERPFVRDLAREPTLVLDRRGVPLGCRASIAPNPDGHMRIRRLLADKYGWADCWIAMVADTERSLAVRLDCQPLHEGRTSARAGARTSVATRGKRLRAAVPRGAVGEIPRC